MSRTSFLAVACVAFLSGCPNGHGTIPLDDLDDQLADATCDYAERCTSSTLGRFLAAGGDCRGTYGPLVGEQFLAQIRAGISAGTVAYHGDLAGQCLDEFASLSCQSLTLTGPSVCNQVFEGLVADGQACNIEQECGLASTCDTTGAMGCPRGTCRHIAQLGEACAAAAGMGCDGNLRCASGTCVRYAAEGETCTASGSECGGGLVCNATSGSGTCTTPPLASEGESCGSSGCASGLVCAFSGTGFTCSPRRTDGTCRYVSGLDGDCTAPEVCTGATSTADGTCGPAPGEGQACSGSCTTGLRCVSGSGGTPMCVRMRHVGESCAGDSACYSGYCNGGTCAAAPLCRTP
jgi:hypothetical protein